MGCSRNERVSSVARSSSVRAGGYALIPSPTSEPGDQRVDARLLERDPHAHAEQRRGQRPPCERCVAERQQQAEEADRDRERDDVDLLRVDGGDHQQGHEVVHDHERQQADAQARRSRCHERERTERERRIGGHRHAPAMGPGTAGVERHVDQHRQRHTSAGRRRDDRDATPFPQPSQVELAPRLEPDDEEEERHQSLAHPLPERHRDAGAPDADRQLGVPERVVGVRPRRVGPDERGHGREQQRDGAGGLGAEEVAHRRREVARPRRFLGEGPRQCVGTGSHAEPKEGQSLFMVTTSPTAARPRGRRRRPRRGAPRRWRRASRPSAAAGTRGCGA